MTRRLFVFNIPMDCLLRLLAMRTSRCRLELLVLVDMWSEEGAWGCLVEVTLFFENFKYFFNFLKNYQNWPVEMAAATGDAGSALFRSRSSADRFGIVPGIHRAISFFHLKKAQTNKTVVCRNRIIQSQSRIFIALLTTRVFIVS